MIEEESHRIDLVRPSRMSAARWKNFVPQPLSAFKHKKKAPERTRGRAIYSSCGIAHRALCIEIESSRGAQRRTAWKVT
jgi:hypothetical protein